MFMTVFQIVLGAIMGYLMIGATVAVYYDFVFIPRHYEAITNLAEVCGTTINKVYDLKGYIFITLTWPKRIEYIFQ